MDADDVLNVRDGADVDSAIVGELAQDATDIEVVHYSVDGRWARINLGERQGWVSTRFLARQEGSGWADMRSCYGTEPFWSLRTDGESLRLSTPEGPLLDGVFCPCGRPVREPGRPPGRSGRRRAGPGYSLLPAGTLRRRDERPDLRSLDHAALYGGEQSRALGLLFAALDAARGAGHAAAGRPRGATKARRSRLHGRSLGLVMGTEAGSGHHPQRQVDPPRRVQQRASSRA